MVKSLDRAAAGEAGQRGQVRIFFAIMAKAVTQGHLVMLVELMIELGGRQIEPVSVREKPAVIFKLVDQEFTERAGRGHVADGQNIGENAGTGGGRKRRLSGETGHRSTAQTGQSGDDCALIVARGGIGPEEIGIGDQWDGVLRVAHEAFKSAIQETLVLLDG